MHLFGYKNSRIDPEGKYTLTLQYQLSPRHCSSIYSQIEVKNTNAINIQTEKNQTVTLF